MLSTNEAHALIMWIQNWKKTYKEIPNLNECIIWFQWKFEDREISQSDKSSIATILKYNSEEE